MRDLVAILITMPAAGIATTPPPRRAAFAPCAVCHKTEKGEPDDIGPNLWRVAGRKAAQGARFAYSPALRKSGIAWTRAELVTFVTKPQARVPGTRMFYPGQPDPKKAGAIAVYLLGLK